MSWDDVIIGAGEHGCMAIRIRGKRNQLKDIGVSEDGISYWVSGYLGLGMKIFKNTPEGKALESMIDADGEPEPIRQWLEDTLIKNCNPTKLKKAIDQEMAASFDKGKRHKMAEIRKSLGM